MLVEANTQTYGPRPALGRLQALLDSMTVNTTFNIHMYLSS